MVGRSLTKTLALVGLGALLLLAPAAALANRHSHHKRGTLQIAIGGLHRGEHPRLLISGPPGFHRPLRAHGHRIVLTELRAGRDRIVAKPAVLAAANRIPAGSKDYASPSTVRARVRAGHKARVTVRYGNVISPSVRASTPAPTGFTGPGTNPATLVLPGSAHVKVGQIVYYPPSARFPLGVFSKVTAITRQGGSLTVSLTPASLSEAFPQINTPARPGSSCSCPRTLAATSSSRASARSRSG